MAFSCNVAIGGVLDALRSLGRMDRAKVFRDAKRPLRADIREHGKQQSGPDGKWRALASSTKERRARGGKRRRKLLGRLPTAIKVTSTRDGVRAESLVRRWSVVHQEGGMGGKHSVIQAREFMWASANLQTKVRDMFRGALKRAWFGR